MIGRARIHGGSVTSLAVCYDARTLVVGRVARCYTFSVVCVLRPIATMAYYASAYRASITVLAWRCGEHKKLSYRRGTARCVVSVVILQITTQQCRNYLYNKS